MYTKQTGLREASCCFFYWSALERGHLPTVYLFLSRLFALRRKRRSTIKLLRNKCSCRASSSSHRLKSAGVLIMQLSPALYLPVTASTSNRVRTKILELIRVKPQISSKYNFKNLRNYLHISNIFCIFALDFKSVLFPVWSNRLWPYIPMSYNIPPRPTTASPHNRLAPQPPRPKIEVL